MPCLAPPPPFLPFNLPPRCRAQHGQGPRFCTHPPPHPHHPLPCLSPALMHHFRHTSSPSGAVTAAEQKPRRRAATPVLLQKSLMPPALGNPLPKPPAHLWGCSAAQQPGCRASTAGGEPAPLEQPRRVLARVPAAPRHVPPWQRLPATAGILMRAGQRPASLSLLSGGLRGTSWWGGGSSTGTAASPGLLGFYLAGSWGCARLLRKLQHLPGKPRAAS